MTDITALIEDSGAVKRGKFKLSDGSLTDYYIDKYAFETNPELLRQIAEELAERLSNSEITNIAGPELGAVPLVTAVSLQTGIPAAFIRRQEDHFGTQARIEGTIEDGDRVGVLEDVTTTGQTILDTAAVIEGAGGSVERLLSIVDRDASAVDNARDAGFRLEYLAQVGDDIQVDIESDR
jgi:orotate phosphoribosyltransferase